MAFTIDLHVHAAERSYCSASSEGALIEAAIRAGLDAVAFTDHDRLIPEDHIAALNAKYEPFRIFRGVEMSLPGGHVLVFGVDDPALEQRSWDYPHLHALVRERGGYMALAHPYRFRRRLVIDIERYPPDALELHSHNTPASAEVRIRDLAERLDLDLLCNSDAHHVSDLGPYCNGLPAEPRDEAELVALLREGPVRCACKGRGRGFP